MKINKHHIVFLLLIASNLTFAQVDSASIFSANALWEKGDKSSKREVYEQMAKANNQLPRYRLMAGIACYKANDFKKALHYFARYNHYLKAEFTYWQAKALARSGKYEKAMEKLHMHTQSALRFPENTIMMDTSFDALAQTDAWIEFWADSPYDEYDALYADAKTQYQDSHFEYALELLDKVLHYRDDLRAYRLRAKVLYALESYKAARDDLDKLHDYFPTHPELPALKTRLLLKRNKKKRALKTLRNALENDPYHLPFYKLKGEALAKAGKMQEAVKALKLYTTYHPADAKALFLTGKALYRSNKHLDALKVLNTLLGKDQSEVAYFKVRGKTYLETETYRAAASDFTMALDLNPSGELYYLRGNARFYSGNIEGACSDWTKALRYGYNDATTNKERLCK